VAGITGFTDATAIYVHENLEMKLQGQPRPSGIGVYWGPHGQSKFLETPFREMKDELLDTVRDGLRRGWTLAQALLPAMLLLQREAQDRVPVEYGDLRRSAFVDYEVLS
jgi:hypothetical protein